MGCMRPATPGFIITLIATVLLAVVSFCVPYFKSVFFLKALFSADGQTGTVTFGTLGYCLELPNGTTCSKPSVGYELDINSLVGDDISALQIPNVVVKWVTYALVLHIVALALAAGSAVFGLLAHIREMAMTCCSTCISGFAAAVALLAFIFDLAFFFLAKSRIDDVSGGSAQMGNAIWLTLAAWVLLFFSGCFYTLGRCCVSSRGPRTSGKTEWQGGNDAYADQIRLDAVKAEADRKARQKQVEGGLPAFYETQPLTGRVEGDHVYFDEDSTKTPGATTAADAARPSQVRNQNGYVQGAAGTRAVDEYYNPSSGASYPPQPQRQASAHTTGGYPTHPQRQGSGYTTNYAPSTYDNYGAQANQQYNQSNANANNHYFSPGGHAQQRSANQTLYEAAGGAALGAAAGYTYGHQQRGTSYHTAAEHSQYPSNYNEQSYATGGYNADTYNNTGGFLSAPNPHSASQSPSPSQRSTAYSSQPQSYYSAQTPGALDVHTPALHDNYTSGYGASTVPAFGEQDQLPTPNFPVSPVGNYDSSGNATSPVRGPRGQRPPSRVMSPESYHDQPPVYEASSAYTPPINEKR